MGGFLPCFLPDMGRTAGVTDASPVIQLVYGTMYRNCVGTMSNSTEGNRSHIVLMNIVYLVFICASYQKKNKNNTFLDLDCSNLFYHSEYTQVHPSYNFLLSGKKKDAVRGHKTKLKTYAHGETELSRVHGEWLFSTKYWEVYFFFNLSSDEQSHGLLSNYCFCLNAVVHMSKNYEKYHLHVGFM